MADLYDRLAADIVNGAQESWVSALTRLAAESLAKACENPDEFRLLSRVSPLGAMRLWAEWEGRVTSGVESAWREAMAEEDDEIVSTLTRRLGGRSYETGYAANVAASAARGMAEIMRRENIALAASAEREWYAATAEAVLRVEGGDSPRRAIGAAVSRLAKLGITTIDYKSGVSTSVDAALRRHLVTQANQARNDVLWRRMDEWECDLVYTTAHYGARPTHAVWQGKVFSRSGRSAKYPPLVEATGYGTAAGLCGVNCRHRMVPYVEGASKLPDTDYSEQERLTGMTGGEYYAATQAQRRMEAAIRATKREVSVGEAAGADMTAGRVRLGELQSKLRAHCREHHLRRDYGRELAYGVPGAQPRALKASASVRKVLGRGSGGAAPGEMRSCPGVLVDRRNKAETEAFVAETLRAIVGLDVEHAVVIQKDGRVFHAVGTVDAVTIEGVDLVGAIVMHNHPMVYGEPYAFGKDDYEALCKNPRMTLLLACSGDYRYEMKAGPRIAEVGYDEAERRLPIAEIGVEDLQHLVMRSLDELEAIRYRRKNL